MAGFPGQTGSGFDLAGACVGLVPLDRLGTVVAKVGSGPYTILMDGHIDCVGVGDPGAWPHDPFAVLGRHPAGVSGRQEVVIRTMQPGAASVDVVADGRVLPMDTLARTSLQALDAEKTFFYAHALLAIAERGRRIVMASQRYGAGLSALRSSAGVPLKTIRRWSTLSWTYSIGV